MNKKEAKRVLREWLKQYPYCKISGAALREAIEAMLRK